MERRNKEAEVPEDGLIGPCVVSGNEQVQLSRGAAGCLTILFLGMALLWLGALRFMIGLTEEGIFRQLSSYESEPKDGWDAARWQIVKEELFSWIVGGVIWVGMMLFLLWLAWRCGRRALAVEPDSRG